MFWFKKKKNSDTSAQNVQSQEKTNFFSRLKQQLGKTRRKLNDGLSNIFKRHTAIDDELLEEIETQLLLADCGVDATENIITRLKEIVKVEKITETQDLQQALKQSLVEILEPVSQNLIIDDTKKPYVILLVGVNGAGKTTTIGKLAKKFQEQGKKVMLAAGDTFRAAAVEQLQIWGERNDIPVIAQGTGSDSAAVIFDAVASARSKNIDVLIADTAGRLHTKVNLMEELKKVARVLKKLDDSAPHEVLIVLDSGIGQNALRQVEEFDKAMNLSGIVLTKLDGTAKGGIIFSIANKFKIPIRFVGVGEKIDDLQEFDSENFVDALLDLD